MARNRGSHDGDAAAEHSHHAVLLRLMAELSREFFRSDGLTLARDLIGKTLVHRIGGKELCGIITETEAYMGVTDRASHAFGGRRTARTETMYLEGGYAYVYLIYGIYSCMNVTANVSDSAEAVLIRAVMPTGDLDAILECVRNSGGKSKLPKDGDGLAPKKGSDLSPKELYALSDGPGKLCRALSITREQNRADLLSESDGFFLRDDGWRAREILTSPRIGIDYAGEAKDYPWHFTAACGNGVPELLRDAAFL